jgi:hypothetical protein
MVAPYFGVAVAPKSEAMGPNTTITRSKLSRLEIVYPPISNQEAVWLQHDPEVEALLRSSDFYMIAGRAEAKFLNILADPDAHELKFTFAVGHSFTDEVKLSLRELPGVAAHLPGRYWLEAGEKMIRLWDGPIEQEGSNVLEWFTTEKLIWDRSRGKAGIEGFDSYREAAIYDLLYVGIAKVGDSFDRLIRNGHKARMEILANESQRFPGARVTDEVYLFMFSVQPTIITTFERNHDFADEDFCPAIDQKRIVADAEKAFVSLLKPQYNVVKFSNYPKGADGLYGSAYVRYGYFIVEDIAFNTVHGRIRGSRVSHTEWISNSADAILVEGDSVALLISGVDFPAE